MHFVPSDVTERLVAVAQGVRALRARCKLSRWPRAMSRHIVGRLKRSNTSRNEASNKDLLVYQWPEAGDLDAGVWNSKDITRGLPENELGVPHDFRTLEWTKKLKVSRKR